MTAPDVQQQNDPLPSSTAERSFYEQEFAGSAIVISLAAPDAATVEQVRRVATSMARSGGRLILVVGGGSDDGPVAGALAAGLGSPPVVLGGPAGPVDAGWLADLWLAVTDHDSVLVTVAAGEEPTVAGELAAALRALKLVVTDPDGGWGDPPRSFADVAQPEQGFVEALAPRQGGRVVPAIETALAGGVTSVNLCRAVDLDDELFTFDGTGTLFTSGGYLRIGPLRVDDLPAVEALVAQGTADGSLRPRPRRDVARLAIGGLGARVLGRDHLAGIVGLETAPYGGTGLGEVSCLYAVSRFSGAGAGGLLVDRLVEQARDAGLWGVFAVTVSPAAGDFFVRRGFREVAHDEVPAAKWEGYDPVRRQLARAFLRSTGTRS